MTCWLIKTMIDFENGFEKKTVEHKSMLIMQNVFNLFLNMFNK